MTLRAKLRAQEAKFEHPLLGNFLLVRLHFIDIPCIGINI